MLSYSFAFDDSPSAPNQVRSVAVVFTQRSDGDFRFTGAADPEQAERRRAIVDLPWLRCRQVHGAEVAVFPDAEFGCDADALVTAEGGQALTVTMADCAPIAVWSAGGAAAAVHAGWRGLEAGVIQNAVDELAEIAGNNSHQLASDTSLLLENLQLQALVGPHICSDCYEFQPAEAKHLMEQWGDDIMVQQNSRLDLRKIIERALRRAGVQHTRFVDSCTSCQPELWFSHRARQEEQRHAMAVWLSN